jgi:hypothetical protein
MIAFTSRVLTLAVVALALSAPAESSAPNELSLSTRAFVSFAKDRLRAEYGLSEPPRGELLLQDLASATDHTAGAFPQTYLAFAAFSEAFRFQGEAFVPAFVSFLQKSGEDAPEDGALLLLKLARASNGKRATWPVSATGFIVTDARTSGEGRFPELRELARRLAAAFPDAHVELLDSVGSIVVSKLRPRQLRPALRLASQEASKHPFLKPSLDGFAFHAPSILAPVAPVPALESVCLARKLPALDEVLKRNPDQCFVSGIALPTRFRSSGHCRKDLPLCGGSRR